MSMVPTEYPHYPARKIAPRKERVERRREKRDDDHGMGVGDR